MLALTDAGFWDCGGEGKITYKTPTPKTRIIPTFCWRGRCNVASAGIGRIMITMSVKICMAALEYQIGPLGKQLFAASGLVRSQKSWMGMQKTKPEITIHRPAIMRNAIVMYVAMRKGFVRKIRMKRNNAESLQRIRVRL